VDKKGGGEDGADTKEQQATTVATQKLAMEFTHPGLENHLVCRKHDATLHNACFDH
jgi:hypothetical protein